MLDAAIILLIEVAVDLALKDELAVLLPGLLDLDVQDRTRLTSLVATRLVIQLLDLLVANVEYVLEVVLQ